MNNACEHTKKEWPKIVKANRKISLKEEARTVVRKIRVRLA